MADRKLIERLEKKAKEMRVDIIKMTTKAAAGHPTSSMSAIDMVVALYYNFMKFDPKKPDMPERDRFILSKGHACPAQYAVLGDLGYFDKKEFLKLRQINSMLQGHPDRVKIPGIEVSSGSLGQGLSVGNGMAWAGKMDGKNYRVYVMLGDGEMQEGQVWEAFNLAVRRQLDNLIFFVDRNHVQIENYVSQVVTYGEVTGRLESFGLYTLEADGNDIGKVQKIIERAIEHEGGPVVVVLDTTAGKGVSFMEGKPEWHDKVPNDEELKAALLELGVKDEQLV